MDFQRFPLSLVARLVGGGFLALAALPVPTLAQLTDSAPASDGSAAVEVTAEDFAFRVPETLPSGWNTLRLENAGEEAHFLIFVRLPEGKTYDDYMIEIGEAYNAIWYELREGGIGEEEAWQRAAETLPAWTGELALMGGSGLVAPGRSTEVTLWLEPGDYLVECYMRSEEGEIHAIEGMSDPLTVTEEPSNGSPPSADAVITVSNDGFEIEGELTAGRRILELHVMDRGPAFGHNLHLARLDEGLTAEDILGWEKWMSAEGMRSPAPVTFVGGVQLLPVGGRGYFTADLEVGRYLLLSESSVWREITVRP